MSDPQNHGATGPAAASPPPGAPIPPPQPMGTSAAGQEGARAHAGGFWSRATRASADSAANAFYRSAPLLRRSGVAFGNWLVSIGWGKFFLLSILLLIFANLACSFLLSSASGKGKGYESGSVTVNVHVVPLTDGSLWISPAQEKKSAPAPIGGAKGAAPDDTLLLQIEGKEDGSTPAVRVDRQGVRILADDQGHKTSVVIDHKGVHIEELPAVAAAAAGRKNPGATAPPEAPPSASGSRTPGGAVRIAPADAGDPEKVADAVEAARDQVQTILQDQMDEKVRRLDKSGRAERESWVVALTTMVIVALIILKVALGSKNKAESQARQASATAAQEGLKRQLAEAQLKTMQAQVEPHFLFNTLASVDYLIETDPARASRMQKNLIQYLRAALPMMREGSSTLGREILQCRSYLEILKMRMDERLQFSVSVPQGLLSATFPPMMLLTLVENAIKHGLEPKPDGGSVSVSAAVADAVLRVAVADSGMGFGAAQRGGTGLGLANVRERLQALYGSAARLSIDAGADGGTIATIEVPYRIDASGAAAAAPVPAAAAS